MSKLDSLIEAALLREDVELLRLADAGEEHTFSPAFEAELDARIHATPKRSSAVVKRIIALVVAAVLLIGSAFAFWDEIIGLFVKAFPKYAELRITSNIIPNEAFHDLPSDWSEIWVPVYMTDGYIYFSASEDLDAKQLSFISADSTTLLFEQYPREVVTLGDNEGTTVPNIFVSGNATNALEKELNGQVFRRIAWSNGTSYFILSGLVSFDELVKIGESISLREIGEI